MKKYRVGIKSTYIVGRMIEAEDEKDALAQLIKLSKLGRLNESEEFHEEIIEEVSGHEL